MIQGEFISGVFRQISRLFLERFLAETLNALRTFILSVHPQTELLVQIALLILLWFLVIMV